MFHLKKIKAGLYLVYDWWDFIYYMVNQINIAIKKKTHVRATFIGFVIKQNTK